ncbi:Uma2 family endonuclease [Methylobacterium organophilum]|uniref:Uma2 family endonuclease n=1 Tax=Methylobacterium organophilum TaxID=410 RepID=UPI001F13D93D|nr:Uma2 family endonuclease [Methylobacterium organophilum]UMY17189.1 Uma2 family endonuclease [Methylobacterium organophilum]
MTPEEFFAWQSTQDGLYELVDGVPVPHVKMMTGASAQHDRTVVNIIISLGVQLRGSGCRPTTDDLALRTGIATIRRPDVTVECGDLVRDSYESRLPRLVVEVLSPSTTNIDRFRKLDEYRRHPSLACILLVETRFPSAVLYRRAGEGWAEESFESLDAVIDLPAIGARLALTDIYEDVGFEPGRAIPTR